MLKKKKKKEETTEKLKFGSVNIKKMKTKKKNDEDRKANRSRLPSLILPQGRSNIWVFPPLSKDMNGFPFVETLNHNNLGPDKDKWSPCQRVSMEQDREDCKACSKVNGVWNKVRALRNEAKKASSESEKKKLNKKAAFYEKIAKAQGVKTQVKVQTLDVTGAYNKTGKVIRPFPKCFGDNLGTSPDDDKYDKCGECAFKKSCKNGVQVWNMQFKAYKYMMGKFDEDIDICNPAAARPIKINRTGEGQTNTSYEYELSEELEVPSHVMNFVEKHAINLVSLIKPATEKQIMTALNGEQVSNDDKEEEKSSGKKKKDVKPEKTKSNLSPKQKAKMREEMMKKMKSKKGA